MTAAHGSEIVVVAVTADGAAAASADRLGGIRLWPVLDGTREPVVIQGTAPRAITVARDGDGFAIGTLDAAGGVHIVRTSSAGAVRQRMTVGDRPALEIDATPEGLLILRADQALELVDAAGAVRARLTPDPGTHIDSILVRGRHAIALLQEDKRLRARRIVLDRGMRWGATTPPFAARIEHVVLSPDGEHIAATRPGSIRPVLIQLATGAVQKTPVCVTRGWPREVGLEDGEFLRGANAPTPLGFVDEKLLACAVTSTLQWWNVEGTPAEGPGPSFGVANFPFAVSARGIVVGIGGSLGLGALAGNKFLGYGVHDVAMMRTGAGGVLISATDQQALVLDRGLRERARLDLGRTRFEWTDVALIDDRYAVIAIQGRGAGLRPDARRLVVVDGVTRAQRQLLPYDVRDRPLAYEPATRLLATGDGPASFLLQLDPDSHTFGAPIRLANALTPTRLMVIDPAQSGGIAALAIDITSDGLLVGELHRDDITAGALLQPRTTYRLPGELRAVDRAGRVYTRALADDKDVIVYAHGARVARLPGMSGMALDPSPDGALIAAFETPRLVLLAADGTVRWENAHWNSSDVAWTQGGELLAQFPSAVAKVDLATGALTERRCGLAFGLAEQIQDIGRGGPSICESAR